MHDLYVQVASSVGMRRCATAAVVGAIQTEFPSLNGSVWLERGCITVDLWLPWAAWLGLGGAHFVVWRKAKWITAKIIRELGVVVRYRVRVHSGKKPKEKRNGREVQAIQA